jgi:PPK2 family polyphosphate:nucleotide phosphotransferase
MKLHKAVIEELTVRPGDPARLDRRSTESTAASWTDSATATKEMAKEELRSFVDELNDAQERLWASDSHALLLIVQGMDASGKDGTIKHVMSGVNPQGCEVVSFKSPSADELQHDFLWRSAKALPERGRIGIFNRSYYEEVLVVRVHPGLARSEEPGMASASGVARKRWEERFEDINGFEHHLHRSGTRIVKIFLHLSKEQQKKRLLERLDDPGKRWKFSAADLAERSYWDKYRMAYEEAITATSTPWAPWYVVPADHKYAARALVGGILVHCIDSLDLRLPTLTADQLASLEQAKARLLAE